MTSFDTLMNTTTLAQRLAEGRIPVPEALRFAMQLAEALRKLQDEGRVHGSVSPVSIALNNNSAELMPAMVAAGAATPYTAPEVLAGREPDSRSDIFSFGTVVYEMLTGRRAYEGSERGTVAPSGSPAVDRFVAGCLVAEPQARLQSFKRVMMELKLLHAAARRAESPATNRSAASEAAMRAEVQKLESRVGARLQEQQKYVAEMQHAVTEAVATLRGQLSAISAELSQSRDKSGEVHEAIEAASGKIIGHVQQSVDSVSERVASVQLSADSAGVRIAAIEQGMMSANSRIEHLEQKPVPAPVVEIPVSVQEAMETSSKRVAELEQALAAASERIETLANQPAPQSTNPEVFQAFAERMSHLEERLESVSKHSGEISDSITQVHESITQELRGFEKQMQSQSAAIESSRTAMAQTDDLVERVVEALESLQTIVLEQSGDRTGTLS
jgi:serine/threonine protein kinase